MADTTSRRGWFMRMGPGPRRGVFAAGLMVALLGAVLPAWADGPESGADPSITLTVTPSQGLADGQRVTVTGAGFPADEAGIIRQCAVSTAGPECDTIVSGIFITNEGGRITPTQMTVQRIIYTLTTTYNCSTQACALVADAGGKSSRHPIRIAGAGTVPDPATITGTPTTVVIPTTVVTPTTVPTPTTATSIPITTVASPTSTTPSTILAPAPNVICAVVAAVSRLLGGLLDGLLLVLGCPPTA